MSKCLMCLKILELEKWLKVSKKKLPFFAGGSSSSLSEESLLLSAFLTFAFGVAFPPTFLSSAGGGTALYAP